MKVWVRLHGFEPCSWTFVWENLCRAFEDAGDEIYTVTGPTDPDDTVEIWWGDPQFWRWSDLDVKARIAIALSEAHSILAQGRSEVISNLKRADLIICPSEAATTALREAPLDVPIRVVNFGVDTEQFPYVNREWSSVLKFLHAGVTQFRKGSWMVPEAFLAAFEQSDSARLTIASYRASPMYTRLRSEFGNHPNIDFVCDLQDSMMPIYEEHHVYVSPHLSEGFGLMPLEAMATGMAGIVARCSAPRRYFSKDFGWWIEMSENYAAVEQCLPDTAGFWRLPDLGSLTRAMQNAYERRLESKEKGAAAADFIHKNLTWDHTVQGIKQAIEEVLNEKDFGGDERIQRGEAAATRSEEYRALC
jgi:glycosyltransferase involved in cell wall biosynthesis